MVVLPVGRLLLSRLLLRVAFFDDARQDHPGPEENDEGYYCKNGGHFFRSFEFCIPVDIFIIAPSYFTGITRT